MEIPEEEKAQLEAETQEILADIERDHQQEVEDTQPVMEKVEEAPITEKVETEKQEEAPLVEKKPAEIKTEVSRQVPLAKYQEKKSEWKEEKTRLMEENQRLKAELEKRNSQPAAEDIRLSEIAQKWELDEELVKDLNQVFTKNSIPDDVLQEINELREEKMISKQKEAIENQYIEELSNLENTFQDVDFSLVDKAKLKELAFSPAYSKTPLDVIFKAFKDDLIKPTPKKRVESSKPDKNWTDTKDITQYTDDDIAKMSDEEFDKYMDAKGQGGLLSH